MKREHLPNVISGKLRRRYYPTKLRGASVLSNHAWHEVARILAITKRRHLVLGLNVKD